MEDKIKISKIRSLSAREYNTLENTAMYHKLSEENQIFINDISSSILNRDSSKGIIENIDNVLLSKDLPVTPGNGHGSGIAYNTYPFGAPTEDIYPRFLAICRNEKLEEYFRILLDQSDKIATTYSGKDPRDEKTVVLLTDKWDTKMFRRYEHRFLEQAISYGISYMFILVTDYGCTSIPFLPFDRYYERAITDFGSLVDDIRDTKNTIDKDLCNRVCHLLEESYFEYTERGGTWDRFRSINVSFDVRNYKWTKNNLNGDTVKGKIKKSALNRFAMSIGWLLEPGVRPPEQHNSYLDAGTSELFMFGYTISWNVGYEEGNEPLNRVIKAINTFMNECGLDIS